MNVLVKLVTVGVPGEPGSEVVVVKLDVLLDTPRPLPLPAA